MGRRVAPGVGVVGQGELGVGEREPLVLRGVVLAGQPVQITLTSAADGLGSRRVSRGHQCVEPADKLVWKPDRDLGRHATSIPKRQTGFRLLV